MLAIIWTLNESFECGAKIISMCVVMACGMICLGPICLYFWFVVYQFYQEIKQPSSIQSQYNEEMIQLSRHVLGFEVMNSI